MFQHRVYASVFTGMVTVAVGAAVGAPPQKRVTEIRSGRIDYKVMLQGNSGAQSLSWTDYGARWRKDLTIGFVMPGAPTRSIAEWAILNGPNYYSGQSTTRTGTHVRLSASARQKVDMGELPTAGKAAGNGTLLGKRCEIREGEGYKVWVWKGVPLRYETTRQANGLRTSIVATRLRENVKLPDSLFTTPTGYQITPGKPSPQAH